MIHGFLTELKHLFQTEEFSGKKLRGFLWVILSAIVVILIVRVYLHRFQLSSVDYSLFVIVLLFATSFFFKPVFIFFYKCWMSLALILGFFVSNVILTLFFFLILTPFGWGMKLLKKDPIEKKFRSTETTYWKIPVEKNFRKQF